MEVALAFLLPARLQRRGPLRVGRLVTPYVHRRRRPLKHEEVLSVSAEVRNQLDAGRTRTDQRHALVMQLVQSAVGVPTRVVVIPTGGMEHVSREVLEA